MTSEREAKVWMVAAAVMLAWACIMVGCTTSHTAEAMGPLAAPSASTIDPTWSEPPTLTLSPDASSIASSELQTYTADSASLFIATPKPVAPQPGEAVSPMDGFDFSELSIAQPLVLAKRLLVASADLLPEMSTEWAATISAAKSADFQAQPVAASVGWAQGLNYEGPVAESASNTVGWMTLDRNALTLQPWEGDPTPVPNAAAPMTATEAKFDTAGVVALVIGVMVLLFGGEAVVVWALRREDKRHPLPEAPAMAGESETSIFRFPEPVEDDAEEWFNRAA
ncbi:MAG: hypothetical protein AAGA25_05645 [Planctomycetota bacterium]